MLMVLMSALLGFLPAVLAAVGWRKQAHSDPSLGGVLFLPQSHRNKHSMPPKALSDPNHEE